MFYKNFFQKISLPVLGALIPAVLLGLTHSALAAGGLSVGGSASSGGFGVSGFIGLGGGGGIGAATMPAASLGGVFYNICANTYYLNPLLTWISYAAGAFFAIQGVHYLRLHSDNPREHKLHTPLMLFMGAMGLLVLPSVVGTLITSLNLPIFGGFLICMPPGVGAGATMGGTGSCAGGGLDCMMINFISDIRTPILSLISMISAVTGLYMIVHGLFKASKYGFDPKTHAMHFILINMVFGALLIAIGGNLYTITSSVFGPTMVLPGSVIQWASLGAVSPEFANAVQAALQFVQIIGTIAFVRGWIILKKVAETGGGGQATLAQGLTHILGGTLAINIFLFLTIMDTTFGTQLLN